jgi:hypothetical protein
VARRLRVRFALTESFGHTTIVTDTIKFIAEGSEAAKLAVTHPQE